MYLWKYYLLKFREWLYFLFIFGFVFFAGHHVFADVYFQNFDLIASSTNISTVFNWIGYGVVSPAHSYSAPNGVYCVPGTSSYFGYKNDTSTFATSSVMVWWNDDNGQVISYNDNSSNIFNVGLYSGNSVPNVYLYNMAGDSVTIKDAGTVNKNTWYNLQTEYNKTNGYVRVNWNYEGWTSWYNTGDIKNMSSVYFYPDFGGTPTSEGLNIDNFGTDNGINISDDYIHVVVPTNNAIYDYRSFLWNYQFSIASSSYWTTFTNLNVYAVLLRSVNNTVVATTTLFLYSAPINTFIPHVLYDQLNQSTTTSPTIAGAYHGIIVLQGDTSILAYEQFDFGIATSSMPNNNAWCENLCDDLTLTQGTTTPVWGMSVPWVIPHFLNDGFCAVRYGACYLFYPTAGSVDVIQQDYNHFQTTFPANVFYQLASTTEGALTASTTMNGTFGMPFIRQTATGSQFYILPVLSKDSMPNLIGQTNTNTFRTTVGWLIWLIIAGCCLLSIFFIL